MLIRFSAPISLSLASRGHVLLGQTKRCSVMEVNPAERRRGFKVYMSIRGRERVVEPERRSSEAWERAVSGLRVSSSERAGERS